MLGRWAHFHPSKTKFVVGKMVRPEELEAIIPYLPQQEIPIQGLDRSGDLANDMGTNVPRKAGAKIIQKMLEFHHSTDQIIKEYASRLTNIHEIMAHPTTRSHACLPEITMKVLKKGSHEALTKNMLWAVRTALDRDPYCLLDPYHDGRRDLFRIMSRADAISHENVRDWVREYQEQVVSLSPHLHKSTATRHHRNPIPGFIEKCRAVIQENRKTRDATLSGSTGPSRVRIEPAEPDRTVWKSSPLLTRFDKDELKVLQYLRAWSVTREIPRQSSTGSTILRAIGMYKDFRLNRSIGFLLLKELGLIPPWLGFEHYLANSALSYHDGDHLADELHLQAEKSVSEFQMEDSMKDLRKDWGDLEVFCIDSPDAHEIDDGLSLEKIDDCTYWVHIHVANPSAFLVPSSAIARDAAHRTASLYLADGAFPLLPEGITQPYFSLGKNRPCITFSAKITLAGDVVDTQISHGILRNVLYFSPEDLQRELGLEQEFEVPPIKITVGGRMPVAPAIRNTIPMSSSQRETLRRLCELSQAWAQKKEQDGAFTLVRRGKCNPKVYLGPERIGQTRYHLHERTAHRYDGDPIISLQNRVRPSRQNEYIDRVVSRLMILAGEIGAMWCSKRNIPIPYRGTFRSPYHLQSEQFKQKYLDPLIARQEEVPWEMLSNYLTLLGPVVNSAVPLRHIPLAAEAYSQVTSPLRRFPDLMTHWQIEAAIRHESRTRKSLIGNTDESYLEFSRAETERLIGRLRARERYLKHMESKSMVHWTQQWLFRAFHYKEALLPELFNVVITDQFLAGCRSGFTGFPLGLTGELSLRFAVVEDAVIVRGGGVRVGDIWEVRIYRFDCYTNVNYVSAIRPVERSCVQTEPWQSTSYLTCRNPSFTPTSPPPYPSPRIV